MDDVAGCDGLMLWHLVLCKTILTCTAAGLLEAYSQRDEFTDQSNNLSFLRKTRRAALVAMVSDLRSKGLDCMVVQ